MKAKKFEYMASILCSCFASTDLHTTSHCFVFISHGLTVCLMSRFFDYFQSSISLQDFQDAEPDILVHSTSAIIERFNNRGINSSIALKALCKKKGLHAEVLFPSLNIICNWPNLSDRAVTVPVYLSTTFCNPVLLLCGYLMQEANLISVDSLGMDVRVFAGAQVQTHRFPFKTRVREFSD